jgi:hypothetical protein
MHMDARLVVLLWLVQLVGCLYLGYRTAKKTGRSMLNWTVMGFLLAVIIPPVGLVVSLVAFLFYPPLISPHPLAAPRDDPGDAPPKRRRPPSGA